MKRLHDNHEAPATGKIDDSENVKSKRAKKKHQNQRSTSGKVARTALSDAKPQVTEINEDVAKLDGPLMADHIARQTKRFMPDLSIVELEDLRVPEKAFKSTSNWSGSRVLEQLPSFLKHHAGADQPELAKAPTKLPGAPHTIVLCAAALRAADTVRSLREFQSKEATVAKMFAKHIKLKDAIEFTRSTRMNIAVGTPQRILDLLSQEQGALSLEHLARIVVDASHVNEKQRGILDMSDTEVPLVRFLAHAKLQARYQDGSTSIIVF